MNETKRVGDIIHTRYKTYKILDISDTELVLEQIYCKESYTRTVKIEDLRRNKTSMMASFCNICSKFDEEYPYLVVDIQDNIAFSKIPHSVYSKQSREAEDYSEFYNENIKLMFYNFQYYIDIKDKPDYQPDVIVISELVSKFLGIYGLWLWDTDLKSKDIYNLLNMMDNENFGDTYDSFMDDLKLYENTNFIK